MKPARCGGGRIPPLLLKIGLIRFHSYALKPSVHICNLWENIDFVWLVHFLLWQAAKPSGDKCTPWKAA